MESGNRRVGVPKQKKNIDSSQFLGGRSWCLGIPFVFLLALYEGFLEEVCIWQVVEFEYIVILIAGQREGRGKGWNILSLLANRIASVWGSPVGFSLTSKAVFHTQLRSLPTLGESFMSGTTITGGIMAISAPPHQHAFSHHSTKEWYLSQLTPVVCAHLERPISPHNQSCVAILGLVQLDIPRAPLLPFSTVAIESKELGPHLENLFHVLLVCLDILFLCEAHDRLEFDLGLVLLWPGGKENRFSPWLADIDITYTFFGEKQDAGVDDD